MGKLNYKPIIITSLIIIFLLIAYFALFTNSSNSNPFASDSKSKIECDVDVKSGGLLLQNAKISNFNCQVVKQGCFSLFSFAPQSFFFNEGGVELRYNDGSDRASYKVFRNLVSTDDVTLSVCTADSSGELILTDNAGNVLERKEVRGAR